MQIKCADCGCLPQDCKQSKSSQECPNCSWEQAVVGIVTIMLDYKKI
jgi:hypothetical protein